MDRGRLLAGSDGVFDCSDQAPHISIFLGSDEDRSEAHAQPFPDRYDAFRVGTHDDLVTALGLAVLVDPPGRQVWST